MTVDRNILPGMKPTRHSFRCGQPLGPGLAHHGMRNLVHHAQAHMLRLRVASGSQPRWPTISVTLLMLWYRLQVYLAALRWTMSSLWIFFWVCGSHTVEAYSKCGRTSRPYSRGIFKLTALVRNLFFIISRLSRLKSVLPSQMLMYIYTSIIQPKIDYAISIWGYTTAHNINKVQRLQNRAARILTGNFDYVNTRGIDLVKNLGLMNVIQRRDYFMLIMMFKSIHGLVPDYICDQITMQRDITVRTTRSTVSNNVHVPHILLECCKNAFAYRGPVLWNALPENIKKCETLNCFKKMCKTTRSRIIDAIFYDTYVYNIIIVFINIFIYFFFFFNIFLHDTLVCNVLLFF